MTNIGHPYPEIIGVAYIIQWCGQGQNFKPRPQSSRPRPSHQPSRPRPSHQPSRPRPQPSRPRPMPLSIASTLRYAVHLTA